MSKCAQLSAVLGSDPDHATDVDAELKRTLDEQLANACNASSAAMAMLTVQVAGRVFQCRHGVDPDKVEALLLSGFQRKQIVISDVNTDPRIPLSLRNRGIESLVSTPILVDNRLSGSLHVLDSCLHDFSTSQLEVLDDIAYVVGKRVERFLGPEMEERRESLMRRAVSPAFAELRNALVPLNLGTSDLRMVASDMKNLMDEVSESQKEDHRIAHHAYDDLLSLIDEMSRASERVREVVMVVEGIWGEGGRNVVLGELLETSAGLALHSTRLVGGVKIPEVPREYTVRARRSVVVAGLSLLLSRAAEIDSNKALEISPLVVELEVQTDHFILHVLGKNMKPDECRQVASEVEMLLMGDRDLEVATIGNTIVMHLRRRS